MSNTYRELAADTNQTQGIAQYAIDMVGGACAGPDSSVLGRVEQFHTDSVACAVSALACGTPAPRVLRSEALDYARDDSQPGAYCFGSTVRVAPEKAVLANSSAAREWDANGTNFGYNPRLGHTRGEFGHNDFYSVVVAAAAQRRIDGRAALVAMTVLDEIRGRLAEVFALRDHKIDHVLHGAIASAAVYGALLGATVEQIESAIGLVVAHYVPFRAIRAGHQLSDSKGASAAISSEMAITSVHRAMRGFVGPADIFRNPQAVFCLFEPPNVANSSPFELVLAEGGSDFAVMGMHFKLGLYEHQSAGAIQAVIDLLEENPLLTGDLLGIDRVKIMIYEPALSIIGDPAKRDPQTRQSADHSMIYIIATLLRKAAQVHSTAWQDLMLLPDDYSDQALHDPSTRALMKKIEFVHGGPDYDKRYPDGIPTSVEIQHEVLGSLTSPLVMYPEGHARCKSGNLDVLLTHKFRRLGSLAVDDVSALAARFAGTIDKSASEIAAWYSFPINNVADETAAS